METARVDVSYRPLRIGWAIHSGDSDAMRKAVRYSCALWGGALNPILLADKPESSQLVDLFRLDAIFPMGQSEEVRRLLARHRHVVNPFFHKKIFVRGSVRGPAQDRSFSEALDLANLLTHLSQRPDVSAVKQSGLWVGSWLPEDPLSDAFLVQFGGFPDAAEIGFDYDKAVEEVLAPKRLNLAIAEELPSDALLAPSLVALSHYDLQPHYSTPGGFGRPALFAGRATVLEDLVAFWNLRACDMRIAFVDVESLPRQRAALDAWLGRTRTLVAGALPGFDRRLCVWTREADTDALLQSCGQGDVEVRTLSADTWWDPALSVPSMTLGGGTALGILASTAGKETISFALPEKPFSADSQFFTQELVASVSVRGRRSGSNVFELPFIPEINETAARAMLWDYKAPRIEPERLGILVGATAADLSIGALPADALLSQIFAVAGYEAQPSQAGLLLRQLLARVGGRQGARVFKIPGVRRLLKQYGPGASFSKKAALGLIASKDQENPDATFEHHKDLFIGPRPKGGALTPEMVFEFLVDKALVRIGADLKCPICQLTSWFTLEALGSQVTCELCGEHYNVARQLAARNEWGYRRSGVLGHEKNVLGAVPVALTLQQLDTAIGGVLSEAVFAGPVDLTPKVGGASCELDCVLVIPRHFHAKADVILGECKDTVPITGDEIERLCRIASALPAARLRPFILLTQLAGFSQEQIEQARAAAARLEGRVIMLTARELEPYRIYDRSKDRLGEHFYASSPDRLAQATRRLYLDGEGGPVDPGWRSIDPVPSEAL